MALTSKLIYTEAGIDTHMAFALGLITSSLQIVAVMGSWLLSAWFGRRAIYLWGTAVNIVMLFALGGVAFATQTTGTEFAQAVLGLLISVQFCLSAGPVSVAWLQSMWSDLLYCLYTSLRSPTPLSPRRVP